MFIVFTFTFIFINKYSVWKKMRISRDTDKSRYRVWDYPIKEQYTHIFKVIIISQFNLISKRISVYQGYKVTEL